MKNKHKNKHKNKLISTPYSNDVQSINGLFNYIEDTNKFDININYNDTKEVLYFVPNMLNAPRPEYVNYQDESSANISQNVMSIIRQLIHSINSNNRTWDNIIKNNHRKVESIFYETTQDSSIIKTSLMYDQHSQPCVYSSKIKTLPEIMEHNLNTLFIKPLKIAYLSMKDEKDNVIEDIPSIFKLYRTPHCSKEKVRGAKEFVANTINKTKNMVKNNLHKIEEIMYDVGINCINVNIDIESDKYNKDIHRAMIGTINTNNTNILYIPIIESPLNPPNNTANRIRLNKLNKEIYPGLYSNYRLNEYQMGYADFSNQYTQLASFGPNIEDLFTSDPCLMSNMIIYMTKNINNHDLQCKNISGRNGYIQKFDANELTKEYDKTENLFDIVEKRHNRILTSNGNDVIYPIYNYLRSYKFKNRHCAAFTPYRYSLLDIIYDRDNKDINEHMRDNAKKVLANCDHKYFNRLALKTILHAYIYLYNVQCAIDNPYETGSKFFKPKSNTAKKIHKIIMDILREDLEYMKRSISIMKEVGALEIIDMKNDNNLNKMTENNDAEHTENGDPKLTRKMEQSCFNRHILIFKNITKNDNINKQSEHQDIDKSITNILNNYIYSAKKIRYSNNLSEDHHRIDPMFGVNDE